MLIDGMRFALREWACDGFLRPREHDLLLADLLVAVSSVANTAGTYGCYLREWAENSQRSLVLRPRVLLDGPVGFLTTQRDAGDVAVERDEIAYLDPPYTKRQYAAYYHLLETVAYGDQPNVVGVTGLRPWEAQASEFCYKTRALSALTALVSNLAATDVFISYSSEGHIPIESLASGLAQVGEVSIHDLGPIGRYRSNASACLGGRQVKEYLVRVTR